MSIFKKKGGQVSAANVHMTEAEAALAQSDFNIEKINEIQNKFTGGAILLVPGRIFIREGLLYKVCRKGLKKRQFFLFNDILVYGSIVASRYSNQQILPLSQMSVSSDCFYQPRVDADFISETDEDNLDVANAFQISHANKSFHVFGQSAADKANWIANLQKHISRVAKTIADSQQQVLTRPVWVPDSMSKECMVCSTKFTAFLRKHHCRRCGRVVCSSCSPHRVTLVAGEGGVAVGPSEGQGKVERTCRECFKEMTAVHNRANSTSKVTKYDSPSVTSSRPPPPSVAAQLVSAAIQSVTSSSKEKEESHNTQHFDNSTDTEDSDDSGNEQEDVKAAPLPAKKSTVSPVPVKRLNINKSEPERPVPVPVARQSLKGEASPPIPLARRSLKTSSSETSPDLLHKTSNQIAEAVDDKPPIPLARHSLKTSSSETSPDLLHKTSDQIAEAVDDEPEPTPPPRKKKLLKQKLKEQQELEKAEKEKLEKDLPESADGQPESPSSKKTRRRNKYSRPQEEEAKASENEHVTAVEENEVVNREPHNDVEGEPCDGVEGKALNGHVEGEACDGVEGEPRDGVETDTPKNLGSGKRDGGNGGGDCQKEPVNHANTDGDSGTDPQTDNSEAASNGVKEGGDSSPSGVKRTGRRRQKFKPQN